MQLNTTKCGEAWHALYFIELLTYKNFSVLMMMKARRIRVTSATPEGRMDGLMPTPQEFDKEVLLLQVRC